MSNVQLERYTVSPDITVDMAKIRATPLASSESESAKKFVKTPLCSTATPQ